MRVDIDPKSPIPLYIQMSDAVRRLLAEGSLRPGDRFPSVRALARECGIHRNTAARAIQELQRLGVVTARIGRGTFLAESARPLDLSARDAALEAALDRLVVEAHALGVPWEELGWRLSRRVDRFRARRRDAAL